MPSTLCILILLATEILYLKSLESTGINAESLPEATPLKCNASFCKGAGTGVNVSVSPVKKIFHSGRFRRDSNTNINSTIAPQEKNGDVGEPLVEDIVENIGVLAGAIIQLKGRNLGYPNLTVNIGDLECRCDLKLLPGNMEMCTDNTTIVCLVANVSRDLLGHPLDVGVRTSSGEDVDVNPNITFTFMENPEILSSSPKRTIISGGSTITLYGKHFTSITLAHLELTTIYHNKEYTTRDRCDIFNDTIMYCITPPLTMLPSTYQSVKDTRINDDYLAVRMGLNLNHLLAYRLGAIDVYADPYFEATDEVINFEIYKDRSTIDLEGSRVDLVLQGEDYKVTIGDTATCLITEVIRNNIRCIPPSVKPTPNPNESWHQDKPPVLIVAGKYLGPFHAGFIDYQYSAPINQAIPTSIVLVSVFVFLIGSALWFFWRKHQRQKQKKNSDPSFPSDPSYTHLVGDDDGESLLNLLDANLRNTVKQSFVPTSKLQLGQRIGGGHFGCVYRGSLRQDQNRERSVAVKTLKDPRGVSIYQLIDFLKEAVLMKDLHHANVIQLLGISISNKQPHVILPYMENGDLKAYVSDRNRGLTERDKLRLIKNVADGMEYIASKGLIHRDLRAVNCMVDKDRVVKVADFGLARDIKLDDYYRVVDADRALPVKWMALEILVVGGSKYSKDSDVWSYGVLMWEVFTRGNSPYPEIADFDSLKNFLQNGRRLGRPENCHMDVYDIMKRCWHENAHERPSFETLSQQLRDLLSTAISLDVVPVYADLPLRRTKNEYARDPSTLIPSYIQVIDPSEKQVADPMACPSQVTVSCHTTPRPPISIPCIRVNRASSITSGETEFEKGEEQNNSQSKHEYINSTDKVYDIARSHHLIFRGRSPPIDNEKPYDNVECIATNPQENLEYGISDVEYGVTAPVDGLCPRSKTGEEDRDSYITMKDPEQMKHEEQPIEPNNTISLKCTECNSFDKPEYVNCTLHECETTDSKTVSDGSDLVPLYVNTVCPSQLQQEDHGDIIVCQMQRKDIKSKKYEGISWDHGLVGGRHPEQSPPEIKQNGTAAEDIICESLGNSGSNAQNVHDIKEPPKTQKIDSVYENVQNSVYLSMDSSYGHEAKLEDTAKKQISSGNFTTLTMPQLGAHQPYELDEIQLYINDAFMTEDDYVPISGEQY